jgi:LEA14-like dessication related protein
MKQFTKFFIVIASAVSLLSLLSCSSLTSKIERPTITLAGIEPLNMTLFEQTYRLKLRVQNPNDFDLPLEAMNYVIELNGSQFGRGVSHQSVTIPAYDSAIIETEVVSNLFSLFKRLQDFSKQGNKGMKYRLFGDIKMGRWGGEIPFDYDGELNLAPTR